VTLRTGSTLRAFGAPGFPWLWGASVATSGAVAMERVVTAWLALVAGGGPLGVGIVLAARMVPWLLFGLVSGTAADQVDRRRLLAAISAAAAGIALALAWLTGRGAVALWQVAAIAFAYGCVQVSDSPARQALMVDFVGRDGAANAIALNAGATRLAGAGGALLGGLILAGAGVSGGYLAVAVGYLAGLGLLATLPKPTAVALRSGPRPPFVRAIADAGVLIWQTPAVQTLVLAAMACEVFAFSYQTVVPSMARDGFGAGAPGLGLLNAAGSLGASIAVIALAGLPPRVRYAPLLATVYAIYGLALVAFARSPSLAAGMVAVLVVGGCAAAFDALQQTMLQLAVPDDRRGRAAGIWAFSIGVAPLGNLELGTLAAGAGVPTALMLNGGLVILGAVALVLRAPAYRWWRPAATVPTLEAPPKPDG
jgi:MFS family permease